MVHGNGRVPFATQRPQQIIFPLPTMQQSLESVAPEVEKKPIPAVRKKRNIKALQLNVEPASAPAPAPPPLQLAATRTKASTATGTASGAAKPAGKRKPPKMDLSKSKGAAPGEPKRAPSPGLLTVEAPVLHLRLQVGHPPRNARATIPN